MEAQLGEVPHHTRHEFSAASGEWLTGSSPFGPVPSSQRTDALNARRSLVSATLVGRLLLLAVLLGISAVAHAGVVVLGFEMGVATIEQVKTTLSARTKVEDLGLNRFSGGPALRTDGATYEVETLSKVVYIFDDRKRLVGVLMTMNKTRYEAVHQFLAAKYKLLSETRPFVGNQTSRFKTADTTIDMDAPHLGFEIEIRYLNDDLLKRYNAQVQLEADAKRRQESGKF